MKIALAQMDVIPGNPGKNLEKMLEMIEHAKQEHVNLIAFSEQNVGGYLLGDRWLEDDFCRDMMSYNEALRKASDGIAIAFGNIYLDDKINERVNDRKPHPNRDGRTRRYNAAYVYQDGKPVKRVKQTRLLPDGVQPKTLLPTYREFHDGRLYFSTLDIANDFNTSLEELIQPFLIEVDGRQVPVGLELCEDLWCEDYRMDGEAINVTKMLIDNGAEHIINLSASPWTYGKNAARDRRVEFLKSDIGDSFVPFYYVNCIGAQNNGKNIATFDGGSTVYNKDGKPIIFAKEPYKEELMIIDEKNLTMPAGKRIEKEMIAQKYDAIITGIRSMKDLLKMDEQPKYVIGLSGGIDSAVVAALLVQAVGADKVLGVNMPTEFNSQKTKDSASYVAEKLGIKYIVVPIQEMVDLNERILEEINADGHGAKLSTLNKENIQAKIRGTSMLSNIASKYGALMTNNGNKLEAALNYATLYGDVNGALAPIGDSGRLKFSC